MNITNDEYPFTPDELNLLIEQATSWALAHGML